MIVLVFGIQVIFYCILDILSIFQECVGYYLNLMLLTGSHLLRLSMQVVVSISV